MIYEIVRPININTEFHIMRFNVGPFVLLHYTPILSESCMKLCYLEVI